MGPIGGSETSVRNYHYSLHNSSEERNCHLPRGGSLKSRERDSLSPIFFRLLPLIFLFLLYPSHSTPLPPVPLSLSQFSPSPRFQSEWILQIYAFKVLIGFLATHLSTHATQHLSAWLHKHYSLFLLTPSRPTTILKTHATCFDEFSIKQHSPTQYYHHGTSGKNNNHQESLKISYPYTERRSNSWL